MKDGKILGKLHILDLLIILVVLAALGIFAWGRFGPADPAEAAPLADMVVEVVVPEVAPEMVAELQRQNIVGQQLIAGNSYTAAVVEDVRIEECTISVDTAQGVTLEAAKDSLKNVVIRIKAPVQKDAPSLIVAGQEVRVGRYLTVKTKTFSLDGSISYVQVGEEE